MPSLALVGLQQKHMSLIKLPKQRLEGPLSSCPTMLPFGTMQSLRQSGLHFHPADGRGSGLWKLQGDTLSLGVEDPKWKMKFHEGAMEKPDEGLERCQE